MNEGITLLGPFKLKQSFSFAPRTINWNFPRLALRKLILTIYIYKVRNGEEMEDITDADYTHAKRL